MKIYNKGYLVTELEPIHEITVSVVGIVLIKYCKVDFHQVRPESMNLYKYCYL